MNPMMAARAYAAVQGGGMPTGLSGAAPAPGANATTTPRSCTCAKWWKP